ncbi:MAG: general secretion pathway protein GspB [Ramlibacter sp.]
MSYILDALRRADSQRERDPARGIHAQPVQPATGLDTRTGPLWPWLLAGVAGVGALAAVAWFWAAGVSPPAASATAANTLAQREPIPVAVAPAAPRVPAPAVPVVPAMEVLPPAPPPAAVSPPPAPAAVIKAAPAPARTASAATPAAAGKAVTPLPDKLPTLAELPPDVQRELPKLVVTGGVYSENPAQRMLVINGQVFNEGGEPAAGVLLEQIRPRTVVLKFRNTRYTVAY